MSAIAIKVDGVSVSVEPETRPTQLFAERKEVIVCKVNGVLKDLWTELSDSDSIEAISISSDLKIMLIIALQYLKVNIPCWLFSFHRRSGNFLEVGAKKIP